MKTKTKPQEQGKHTPGVVRRAQDLAADLGHLNKGYDVTALYSAAPDLLAAAQKALREATKDGQGYDSEIAVTLRAAIARAEQGGK